MAFKPRSKTTAKLLGTAKALVPFAVLYAVLLAVSWTPDSFSQLLPGSVEQGMKNAKAGKLSAEFMPTAESVGKLLSQPLASLSAWAHLQFISFFCARWIWMDGLAKSVRTTHSVLLCAVLAPLGFLSHIITCSLSRGQSASPGADRNGAGLSGVASRDSSSSSFPDRPANGGSPTIRSSENDESAPPTTSSEQNGSGSHSPNSGTANGAFGSADSSGQDGTPAKPAHQFGRKLFGGRGQTPDWLTIEEPVYVNRK